MTEWGRRTVLQRGASVAGLTTLAGCLASGNRSTEPELMAAFHTLAEFTRAVVGDTYTVTNAVPTGEHGHGWEPPASLLPEITASEAFIYLDADGFQPWAESAADELAADYPEEVPLIDALGEIELLEYESDYHESATHDPDDLGSASDLELLEPGSRSVVADYHFEHWHGSVTVSPAEGRTLTVRVLDGRGTPFPLASDGEYQVTARSTDEDVLTVDSLGEQLRFNGQTDGETSVVFELRADDAVTWETEPLTVTVDADADRERSERDHGRYDVKFFSDPVLAQESVRTIRDELIALDPEHEATFRANAADYIERLDALHNEFQTALADREHDLVVLAGHDSFTYLGARYGFEIYTAVGLSPDDNPSNQDIAAAVDLVEEHGIEYVLWDAFDGDRTAQTIVDEADTAHGTANVSAAESYRPEWKEAGYHDYIGQMREITLPALQRAMGATDE